MRKQFTSDANRRRAAIQNRILAAVLALLFVQIGLFMFAWEGALGRHYDRAVPYFILSATCFAANLMLLKKLRALDSLDAEENH